MDSRAEHGSFAPVVQTSIFSANPAAETVAAVTGSDVCIDRQRTFPVEWLRRSPPRSRPGSGVTSKAEIAILGDLAVARPVALDDLSKFLGTDDIQFGAYLGEAQERGEIDPPVELDVVLPVMMSIAHGMALNDLPARGVPLEKLEILFRAIAGGMLRPAMRKPG